MSLTKSRKTPTRKILPLFLLSRPRGIVSGLCVDLAAARFLEDQTSTCSRRWVAPEAFAGSCPPPEHQHGLSVESYSGYSIKSAPDQRAAGSEGEGVRGGWVATNKALYCTRDQAARFPNTYATTPVRACGPMRHVVTFPNASPTARSMVVGVLVARGGRGPWALP